MFHGTDLRGVTINIRILNMNYGTELRDATINITINIMVLS